MRAPAVRILNVHLEKLQKRYPVPEEAIASPSIWQLLFPLFKSIALDSWWWAIKASELLPVSWVGDHLCAAARCFFPLTVAQEDVSSPLPQLSWWMRTDEITVPGHW